MKPLLCAALLLLTFSLNAQAPVAVPIPKEPHHHLVLENEYVRKRLDFFNLVFPP